MNYKVTVNRNEITYGPLIERSRFSDEEWMAIYTEMVKQRNKDLYDRRKGDEEFINCLGQLISLEERYEALLELLPQDNYSKSGTHPKWVANAVEHNTLNKGITQDDVSQAIKQNDTFEGLKSDLEEYFNLN